MGWWVAFGLLVVLYAALRIQGCWYGFRAGALQRELNALRPALTTIVQAEQRKKVVETYRGAFDEIRASDLKGDELLIEWSRRLPASVTLERIEARAGIGVQLWGRFEPGIRPPEEAFILWAQGLRDLGYAVRVKEFFPNPLRSGQWRFALVLEDSP